MLRLFFYGTANLAGIVFCIVFLWIGIRKYRSASYTEKLKPLKFLYILLIILEFIKILYHIATKKEFPPQRYPIVFCSLVMFLYPIICHANPERIITKVSKAVAIIPSLVIGMLYIVIVPQRDSFVWYDYIMNFHSHFYHFCMLGGALYMIVLKLYDFDFSDFLAAGLISGAYFVFATILSLLIGGDISYFGPDSTVVAFVYDIFGYAVGNILLIITVTILSFLIYGTIKLTKKSLVSYKIRYKRKI